MKRLLLEEIFDYSSQPDPDPEHKYYRPWARASANAPLRPSDPDPVEMMECSRGVAIRRRFNDGVTKKRLCSDYNISHQTLNKILQR